VGAKLTGRVTNITDYGAFVELEDGVEGLIHVSEMSWTKKNVHPGKIVSTSQEVDVMVLDVDSEKRRISLGLKQTMNNPWEAFRPNTRSARTSKAKCAASPSSACSWAWARDLDGMVHINDIDWESAGEEAIKKYTKGDAVKARSWTSTSRRSASRSASSSSPRSDRVDRLLRKNSIVTTTVRKSRPAASKSRSRTAR
jgi:small subunit ribosomal protein S1